MYNSKKNYFIYILLLMYLAIFGDINNCFAQIKHTVSFSKSDLEMTNEVERDENTYTTIAFSSLKSTEETGKPCLPVKYIKLIIPADQDVKNITIDRTGTSEIQVSYPIAPAQSPVPLSIEYVVPEFVSPDPKTYDSDANYPPESVELVHSGYFDGANHIVTLAVYPVQYNPKSSKILFSNSIDFTLNLAASESPKIKVQNRNLKNQKIYDSILKKLVDNPADILLYQNKPVLSKANAPQAGSVSFYEYVVITRDSLASCFDEFLSWKIRKGLDAGVVTIEDILTDYSGDYISGIYDDAGSIRQYLSDAYQSGTVWALIAGDHITSPIRYGAGEDDALWTNPNDQAYKIPADLYFADFTGDWNVDTETPTRYGEPNDDDPDYEPEIFVGRLPVSNSQEIVNWVEKVLLYEQNPGDGDYSYLTNTFWIRGANIWVSPNTITPHCPSTFSHEVWEYGDGSYNSGSEVVTEMSDHYGLLNWHCHGGTNVFRVKALNEANRYVLTEDDDPETQEAGDGLDNMTNNKYYSVVYSICCLIAAFDDYHPNGDWYMGESMAEGFTNMFSNICGPNLLGNTRDGYQYDSPELQCEFYDLITDATNDPDTYGSYLHLGVSELVSKDIYNDHFLSYSHNLFGCPETRIWTATPSTLSSASVTVNSSNIVVNAGVTGCDICVSSGNNGSSYYLAVSDVQSYTFSTSVRPLYITITKPNYIPYTAVTGGTFTTAETWFGNLHVLGTVTVTGSGSLTLLPGTKVMMDGYYSLGFYDSARLIAEGTADSPILFTSTSNTARQSWNRLYFRSSNNIFKYCEVEYGNWAVHFYGYPSTGNVIENCTLHDNDQGIRIERSSFDIKNCEIYDNRHNVVTINNTQVDIEGTKIYDGGRDGIYSLSNNTLNLYGSVIENNGNGGTSSRNGIYTGYNDVINIGDLYYEIWEGYNTIRNNYSSEVYAYSTSQVQILYNSIHDDDGYEVYNSTGNNILGLFNWWGEAPPNSSQFSGSVVYCDYFESQPSWEGQTRSGQLNKSRVMLTNYISPEENIANLKNLIASNSKADQADSALKALYAIVRSDYVEDRYCEKDGFYSYLSNLYESFENYPLGKRALQYMIAWKMLSGEIKTAIELSLKALDCLTDSERMGVMGNLVNLYTYNYQFDEASEILTRFGKESDTNEVDLEFLTASLKDKIAMHEEEKVLAKGSTPPQEESVSLLPEKFKLYKAFPNPFNPKTTLTFDLPEEARVEIVVYDLMGREIWKSAKTNYSAGTYSVVWNGTNHSGQPVGAGLYLVRLNSAKYNATQKVLLMK